MKKAVFEIYNKNHFLVIDTFNNTIAASAPGGIYPTMKLSHNNAYALKFNKTNITVYNTEMFVYMLQHDSNVFNNVYGYIKNRSMISDDLRSINEIAAVTIPAFYNYFNDNTDALVSFFESCSSSTRAAIIADHICYNHDAKMTGIISLSTYVGQNIFCKARCNNCDNAICKYCYADSLTAMRTGLKNKLIRIHAILTRCSLCADDIPVIDPALYSFFRFESFGDLNNTLQFENYNLFAACNPGVNFTLWTKNPGLIQQAINDGTKIANNLVIGLSSLYLNTPDLKTAQKYDFIRFLFTVYDDQFIQDHNIIINCGARHCITCGLCYKYLHEFKHGLQLINERKK